MKKLIGISILILFISGCGSDDADTGNSTSKSLSLDSIPTQYAVSNGTALNFKLSSKDPNGLAVTYSAVGTKNEPGMDPFGMNAMLDDSSGDFSWDPSSVTSGSYFIEFSVANTNGKTDSQVVKIIVQDQVGQYQSGANLFTTDCADCHRPTGSSVTLECVASGTFYDVLDIAKENTVVTMRGYAPNWKDDMVDKNAAFFYLHNVDPVSCRTQMSAK